MKDKLTAFLLAVLMVAQVIAPQAAWASGNNSNPEKKQDLVKVGELDTKSYPKLDNKTILAIQKQAREKQKSQKRKPGAGFFSKDNPYLPGQNPTDEEKAAAFGRIRVIFETEGLNDNGILKDFQWKEIFGEDSNGNPTNAKIHFIQRDAKTGQELGRYTLNVNQAGEYKWTDALGKEALLPLYSNTLEPYKYDASLEYQISDKVKLLAMEIGTTDEETTFTKEGDKNVADIPLKLKLGQVASTKFESEWKTSLDENSSPQVEGLFNTKNKDQNYYDIENLIAFPKNNADSIKLRNDNVDPNNPPDLPYDQSPGLSFRNVPEVSIVEGLDFSTDPDNGTPTYNFDEANKTITTLDKKHKYKYDVINGGKLTMTEIIPVTFDANGGKFASLDENADQKIIKEVEYEGTLTDKAEDPTKDRETFKGWSETKGGTTAVTDEFFKNIKEAKTLYAIWDNNEITAEELTVHETFKDGTGYVNDFIPTLAQLMAQVKIKDANGVPQALAADDSFEILNDSDTAITGDVLKEYFYEKLQEKDNPKDEPTRVETVKAKVTVNGTSKTVEIPIKVIKNIYEAKTLAEKPFYVPDGYVKVTLDPTTKAKDPQKTHYYVNPKAQVVIPGKDPVGTGDNQFTKWLIKGTTTEYKLADKPRHQFEAETTIEAQYVSDVFSGNPDGSKPDTVPENYVKVSFTLLSVIGGKIADDATTVYYVNPDKEVTIPQPETIADTGYEFNNWNHDTTTAKKYANNTTVIGSFKRLDSIIPATNDDGTSNTIPDGYVTVTFTDGVPGKVHGKITSGKTVYYVNPKAKKQLKHLVFESHNSANRPIVTPDVGYEFTGWLQGNEYNIVRDVIVPAEYKSFPDVIPQEKEDGTDKPDGYITVTFSTEANGKIEGTTKTTKVVYVNSNKGVVLKDEAPEVSPNAGFEFTGWDTQIEKAIQYKDKDVVKAKYKTIADVVPQKGEDKPEGVPDNFVKVTFVPAEKGTMAGAKIFWVNPEVKVIIPVKDPVGATYFKFNKWKLGENADGADYTPSVETQFTKDTTITATYEEAANIIPYDPKEPITRPDGYIRVTFEAEEGINLSNVKAYYVKKGANITLVNSEIAKPTTAAKTGYEFKEWDKKDNLVLGTDDVVVKALANTLPDTKEKKQGEQPPAGYVEVKFVAGENGTVEEKTYYVNPNKYVTLTPPAAKGNTGYEFGSWSPDASIPTVYDKDTTITASFNGLKDIIPKTDPDGTENKQPAGYKTVTFVIDPTTGGKIVDNEITVYYVNPDKEVTVPQPKTNADTGYEFEKWDQDTVTTAKKYDEDTTVKGNFKKLEDIIPSTDDQGKDNAKPDGYITVTFDKGEHGTKIEGQTVYYVNPKANKTVGDLKRPTVTSEVGYHFEFWDKLDTLEIKEDLTVVAKYDSYNDIIPKTKDNDSERPEGYITVTFEKGEHGKGLTGQAVYYVNPNKAVVLEGKAPTAVPYTGYQFARWDTTIDKAIQYEDGDKITALYNKLADISETEVHGYVKVEFKPGTNGSLEGIQAYWIKPGVEVDIPAPTVKPNVGYKFDKWDNPLTVKAKENDPTGWDKEDTTAISGTSDITVTAQYAPIADVIPKDNPQGGENEKPDGYITVKFSAEEDGKIKGTDKTEKIVYVNPNKAVKLEGYAPEVTPNTGFTFADWDASIRREIKYQNNDVIKAKYNAIGDVIPQEKTDGSDKPEGYLTVTFNKGDHGELSGTTVYYVKPNKQVTVPAPSVTPTTGYEYKGWDKALAQTFVEDTTITAQYAKKEKPVDPTPTPKPDPAPQPNPTPGDCNKACDQPNQPNQPNVGKDALNTTDHYQYLIGYPDGNFGPNKGMTRAEAATMFTRLLNERPVKWRHYNAGLTDIRAGDWYANTVGYAVQRGIVSGYPDGSFKPNKPITRAEFAAIASRFDALAQGNDIAFSDLAPSHWGYSAIRSAATKGWISGYPDNTFRPEQAITRAEVTAITNRMLNRHADLYWIDAHPGEVIRFGDLKRSDWYFEPIMEATMGHDFIRDRDGKTEHWTGINGKSFI